MKMWPSDGHDLSGGCCAVCGRSLAPAFDEGLVAYWTVVHDGIPAHLCPECHTPEDGGIYVAIPTTRQDRWMPVRSAGKNHPRQGSGVQPGRPRTKK